MKFFKLYKHYLILLMLGLMLSASSHAQQIIGSGDTTRITIPASKSSFGLLGIPSELMNTENIEGMSPMMRKFELNKDYTEEYKKYGLMRPEINLHLDYYNPQKSWHPALYALALVAAFFNNRITTIQEEQYTHIMNELYNYPTSTSRYGVTQFNISKGVFGRPDITVSGYKTFMPEVNPYANPMLREDAIKEPTKK
ncbi:MAG: hypothetical protein LBL90_00045 [Prevotellaceae bacterium]|jgi:hypothetical protein|nr:hypothetical protein [Prevotellaceae bacterium]